MTPPRCECNGKPMKFKGTEDDDEGKLRWYTHLCETCGSMHLQAVRLPGHKKKRR